MVVEDVKTEPYNMEAGNVTAVKLTIFYIGDNPAPLKEKIIEINPVPFKDIGQVVGALAEHIRAKTELEELKKHYDSLKETCRRTHKEAEAILKRSSFAETAEEHRLETERYMKEEEEHKRQAEALKLKETPEKLIVRSEEKPAHEESVQAPPHFTEPETSRQQAERIYDKVLDEIVGKKVTDEDIIAAVLKAGAHPDRLIPVTEEINKLLKERGAIDSLGNKVKRLLRRDKKGKKEAK